MNDYLERIPYKTNATMSLNTVSLTYRNGKGRPTHTCLPQSAVIRRPGQRPPTALRVLPSLDYSILSEPLTRDIAATLTGIVGARYMVRFFELLKDRKIVDQTLSRKLVHTLAGPLFVLSWALYSSDPSARFLAMIAPALNGIRLILIGNGIIQSDKTVKAMSRTGDPRELLRGPLYYVVVLLAVTLFYWRESPTGLLVVSVMCGGDGLADIVGRNFGKSNPLSWNPAKSWAGTLAMTAGGWGMSMGLIIFFSRVLGFFEVQDIGAMTLGVSAICVAAAAIESLPINKSVDDNLSVPGVAAVMGSMLLQITAMLAI